MKNNRIVFMGTGDFSLMGLKALFAEKFDIVAVYTRAPKPSGRDYKVQKSVVHEFAESNGIPVYTPKTLRCETELDIFKNVKPDTAVVSSYGLIIPQAILAVPHYGFINIHASLLPRWRGAAPIQSAILAGDKFTGISIMKMDTGVDTGDIISMKQIEITSSTAYGSLSNELGKLGAKMIVDTLSHLEDRMLKARKQSEQGSTYASKITKETCRINWNVSAEEVVRRIMAFSPSPAAWSEINGIRLKIINADSGDENVLNNVGTLFEKDGDLMVYCKSGVVRLITIQPAGKNEMSGRDFLRGHRDLLGKAFEI